MGELSPGEANSKVTPEVWDRVATDLAARLAGTVRRHAPLAPMTSFRVGGPAAVLIEPGAEADLEVADSVIARLGLAAMVMGRGTNLLISDDGFPGVVIRMARGFEWIRSGGNGTVEAGGGVSLARVANWAAGRSLQGMEFAVAIPATVGGGVAMNAGAHGQSMSDVLESARVWHLGEGRIREMAPADLEMSYRRSSLGPGNLVCSARFRLAPGDPAEIASRMSAYRQHRAGTQPSEAPNAGSMFKNPPGQSAGKLIESAGLRGYRIGGAEVSRKHANFFFAHPGARAQDVYDLMAHVQSAVEVRSGVTLLPEVRLVGLFEGAERLKTMA